MFNKKSYICTISVPVSIMWLTWSWRSMQSFLFCSDETSMYIWFRYIYCNPLKSVLPIWDRQLSQGKTVTKHWIDLTLAWCSMTGVGWLVGWLVDWYMLVCLMPDPAWLVLIGWLVDWYMLVCLIMPDPAWLVLIGWLVGTCWCISWIDQPRQLCVLPHWDRSCRWNLLCHPATVYW